MGLLGLIQRPWVKNFKREDQTEQGPSQTNFRLHTCQAIRATPREAPVKAAAALTARMHALWEIRFSAAALRLFVSTTGQSDEQRRQEAWTTLTRLQPLPHTSLAHITHAERTPRHGAIDGIAPTRPTDPRTARLREPGASTRTAQSDTDSCTSWLRLIIQ